MDFNPWIETNVEEGLKRERGDRREVQYMIDPTRGFAPTAP